MVKTYLKYEPSLTFGLIASSSTKIVYDPTGKFALTAALHDVLVWDLKLAEVVFRYTDPKNKSQVTAIQCHSKDWIAIGYQDGTIRLFRPSTPTPDITFHGHTSTVTVLKFTHDHWLISGSKDTNIVIWDVLSQQGHHRCVGHQDEITHLDIYGSNTSPLFLLSSSKDTSLKIWDWQFHTCIHSIYHTSEIWHFAFLPSWTSSHALLMVDAGPHLLKAYPVHLEKLLQWVSITNDMDFIEPPIEFPKKSSQRTIQLLYLPDHHAKFIVASLDSQAEVYRVLTPDEAAHRALQKQKQKKKKKATPADLTDPTDPTSSSMPSTCPIRQRFVPQPALVFPSPLRSFTCFANRWLVHLQDNRIGHGVFPNDSTSASKLPAIDPTWIDHPGHRGAIQRVYVSPTAVTDCLTLGMGVVKVWHHAQCTLHFDVPGAQCAVWVPVSNRHRQTAMDPSGAGERMEGMRVVVGTLSGTLVLLDLCAGSTVFTMQAHQERVRDLHVLPDRSGFVSCSADHHVHVYTFQATNAPFVLAHALNFADDVLAVAVSPRYLAVALLDTSVHVFHADTFAFKVTLYGHKLPVVSLAISSDQTLIVTGSVDKSMKLWGTDFGDLHRSVRAHTDAVTCVRFLPNTHYVVSSGKDRRVKWWDMDTAQLIDQAEHQHLGEVTWLDVARFGDLVVSCSTDRSVCRWSRTDHVIVPVDPMAVAVEEAAAVAAQGMVDKSKGPVSLDVVDRLLEVVAQPGGSAHALVSALDACGAKQAMVSLETHVLLIPFTYVGDFLSLVQQCVPFSFVLCRFTLALLKVHQGALANATQLRTLLTQVHLKVRGFLRSSRALMGKNLAASTFLLREKKGRSNTVF